MTKNKIEKKHEIDKLIDLAAKSFEKDDFEDGLKFVNQALKLEPKGELKKSIENLKISIEKMSYGS